MSCALTNNVLSNLVQIPLVFATVVIVSVINRKCESVHVRDNETWRLDVRRNFCASIVSLTVLCGFSYLLNGCQVRTFLLLAILDISVGTSLDALCVHAMIKGGFSVGYYGDPVNYNKFIWQCIATCIMVTSTRCVTSAIASLMSVDTESWLNNDPEELQPWAYLFTPCAYVAIRYCMLDTMNSLDYECLDNLRVRSNDVTHTIECSTSDDEEVISCTTTPNPVVAETRQINSDTEHQVAATGGDTGQV